jgi:hypothetical protein
VGCQDSAPAAAVDMMALLLLLPFAKPSLPPAVALM